MRAAIVADKEDPLKGGTEMPVITAAYLNRLYGINVKTGRYRKTGDWYEALDQFPATLWAGPPYGYIRFDAVTDLKRYSKYGLNSDHPSGQITARKGRGISTMPGYVTVGGDQLDEFPI